MAVWHVIPEDDVEEHEISEGCWCEPVIDDDGLDVLWVHVCVKASMEKLERKRKLS